MKINSRLLLFISAIFISISAMAGGFESLSDSDAVVCTQQLDFMLGAENDYIQKFGYKKCFNKAFQSDENKLCECAKHNQKIIGPLEVDKKNVQANIQEINKEKIEQQLKKIALNVIKDFTSVDGILELPESTLTSCSLNNLSKIKCEGSNNLLSLLGGNQFLDKIKQKGQCEIEMTLGNESCSNGAGRLNEQTPKACVNDYILNQLAFKPHEFATSLYSKEKVLRRHPLFELLNKDDKFKELLQKELPEAQYDYQMNLNILKSLNTKKIIKYVSQSFEDKCHQSFSQMKQLLCQSKEQANLFSRNELDNKRPRKKDALDDKGKVSKDKLNELKLRYQYFSYEYCQQSKPIKTIEDNLLEINSKASLPNSLPELISNINTDYKFEAKDFCSMIQNNSLKDLLVKHQCDTQSSKSCEKLLSYQAILERKIDSPNNNSSSPIISMSESLQIIYGKPLDKVQSSPVSNAFQKIKNDNVEPAAIIISERSNPKRIRSTLKPKTNDNFQPKTVVMGDTKDDHSQVEIEYNTGRHSSNFNPTIKSATNGVNVRRVGNKAKEVTQAFQNEVTSRLEDLNNEIKKTLNRETNEEEKTNTLPTKTISPKNAVANTSSNNTGSDLSTGSFNNETNDIPAIVNIDRSPSSITPSVNKVTATATDNVPLAFMMVKKDSGVDSNGNNALEEIELVFQNGQKPELIRLNEKDLKKFIEYIKKFKPFILTKSFNLNGYEEKVSAKIFPLKNGKFYIEPVGSSNPKLISQLKKELDQAIEGKVTL